MWYTNGTNEEPNEKQVFIKQYYDRESKMYWCERFSDMNDGIFLKGETTVYTDFIF